MSRRMSRDFNPGVTRAFSDVTRCHAPGHAHVTHDFTRDMWRDMWRDGGREITLQGTQEDVNRVSVRIPAGVARCDAYMGGRPASRTRRMFNNVTVGGRAVVGVIDRSDPREA